MTSTPAEADEALTLLSRADAHRWVGEHAMALAASNAYSVTVQGTSFADVEVVIQMQEAAWPLAQAQLTEARDAVADDVMNAISRHRWLVHHAGIAGRTFRIEFVITTEEKK